MNLKRWLLLLPLGLLGASCLFADTLDPHFEIIVQGFDAGQPFDSTIDPSTIPPDLPPCLGCQQEFIIDPLIKLNGGGGSTDLTPGTTSFSFTNPTVSCDPNIVGAVCFANETLQTITSLAISFTISAAEFNNNINNGIPYTCDGGPYFSTCGFSVTDPPQNTVTVTTYFSGGPGIPSVPEPAEWAFLSLAFAGIVIARRFKFAR
jgi:hypothetical protein